jgi:O-antigen ligase
MTIPPRRGVSVALRFNGSEVFQRTMTARRLKARSPYLLGITLGFALYGYPTVAPIIELVSPEGSGPAIALRIIVLSLSVICVYVYPHRNLAGSLALLPMFLFLALYTLRLYDNFFLREFSWQAEPLTTFGFLLAGTVLPAFALSRTIANLDDQRFLVVQGLMIVIFLVGLSINFDTLLASSKVTRASLAKLNPIGLGDMASTFALLPLITPTKNPILTSGRYTLCLVLVGIAAFSQSRGPIVGMGIALFAYGLAVNGSHKIYLIGAMVILAAAMIAAPLALGVDLIEMALARFLTAADSSDPSAMGRVDAWRASLDQFWEAPLFGDRVFEPTLLHYPHNIFVESLISLGILGTLILFAHLALTTHSCFRLLFNPHSTILGRFISLLTLKEFVQVQFSGAIWGNITFWIASACVITLAEAQERRVPALKPWHVRKL